MTGPDQVELVTWPARTYAFVPRTVTLQALGAATREGLAEAAGAIARHGLEVEGPAFVRYRRIDMAGTLDIEIGLPVRDPTHPVAGLRLDRLPSGRYARLIHRGPYDGLLSANAALIRLGEETGLQWAMRQTDRGQVFDCRLEVFRKGPSETTEPADWITEIAIRIADDPGAG